jgi:chromosome partitioning protein
MPVISFCNQKGGCGKTTAAVHFAFWLYKKRKKVHFIDADAQASGSFWMSALGNVISTSKIIDANDLIEQLPVLAENSAFVVVDGAPNVTESTRAILCLSNVSVTPIQPTGLDLHSASEAIRLIKSAQKISGGLPQPAIFLSRAAKNTRLKDEALTFLKEIPGVNLLKTVIHNRQVIADSFSQDTTVWSMKGAKEAAEEFDFLCQEIWSLLK